MVFVYPVPQRAVWERAVNSLPSSLSHWKPLNPPINQAASLFVSLWQFRGVAA